MAVKREQVVQTAEKYVARGKIEPAIKEYKKLLAENPNDIATLNRVGDLYARLQRNDEAIDFFVQIAEQYTAEGFFPKATAIYKKIIKLDPTRLDIYEKLAELYGRQGLVTEARSQYQVLADYYQKHENAASAIGIYQKLVQLEPENPTFHVKLAEIYQAQKLIEKALGEYRTIAEMMIAAGHGQEAAQVYERALDLESGSLAFITDAVLALRQAGLVAAAARLLAIAVDRNPEATGVARLVGAAEHSAAAAAVVEREALPPPAPPAPVAPPPPPRASRGAAPAAAAADTGELAIELPEFVLRPPAPAAPPGPPVAGAAAGPAAEATETGEIELDLDEVFVLDLEDDRVPSSLVAPPPDMVDEPRRPSWSHAAAAAPEEVAAPPAMPTTPARPATAPPPPAAAAPPVPPAEPLGGITADEAAALEESLVDFDLGDLAELPVLDVPAPPAAGGPRLGAVVTGARISVTDFELEQLPDFDLTLAGEEASLFAAAALSAGAAAVEPAAPEALPPPPPGAEPATPDSLDLEPLTADPFGAEAMAAAPPAPEPAAPELFAPQPPAAEPFAAAPPFAVEPVVPFDLELEAALPDLEVDWASAQAFMPESPAPPEPIAAPPPAHEARPRERDEDLVTEAEVLARYGLEEKALERLREALRANPRNLEAHAVLVQLHLDRGRHARAVEQANVMAKAAGARAASAEPWLRVKRRLAAAGFQLEGDLVGAPPQEPAAAAAAAGVDRLLEGLLEPPPKPGKRKAAPAKPAPPAIPGLEAVLPAPKKGRTGTIRVAEAPGAPPPVQPPATAPPAIQAAAAPPAAAPAKPRTGPAKSGKIDLRQMGREIAAEEFGEIADLLDGGAGTPPAPARRLPDAILDDTGGMSWLDEADARRAAGTGGGAGGEGLFAAEEEFFDLAAEIEQELSKEGALGGGGDLLVGPREQSLEEIVEGFKKGVSENLSATDYETHFNLGIAYREMGLLDEAIGEFQLAAKSPAHLVSCCSMLGLCFLDKGLPELAIKWYRRGLAAPGLVEEDQLGLLYDLGNVQMALGEPQEAYRTFVELYGINTNYRDVVAKLEELGPRSGSS